MAEYELSILAEFEDQATRGIKKLKSRLSDLNDMGRRGGLLGGLFGRFGAGGAVRGPGGLGGIVAGIGRLTAKAVAMPAKILSAFSNLLPKIGGIASSAMSSVVNVIQGLAVTAANVAGHIVNVFTRAFRKVASVAGRVFGKVAKWGSIAFAGVTVFSVRQAGKVQDAWNEVRTILRLGQEQAGEMLTALRDEAIRTGKSLTETIRGYYQVVSAGFREPQKALELLRVSLEGAVGGAANFPTVVKALSRTMRNFERPVGDVRKTMDQLLKTIDIGQIQMSELAGVFGRVGNAGAAAGAGLEEMLAALGIMAQTGPVRVVATQLRGAMLSLAKPTQQTTKALKKLQKRGLDLSAGALRREGLVEYLDRLQQVQEMGLLQELFPERRAFLGVQTMIRMSDEIEEAIGEIGDASGKTRRNFEKMMDSVLAFFRQSWTTIKDIATSFGMPIADWLVRIRNRLQGAGMSMDWFRDRAKAAGEAVRDTFKDAVGYITELGEGREFSFEGLKGALNEVKNDAIAKAGEAWAGIKASLWPKIKTAFSKLIDDIWGMVGDEMSSVADRLVASFFDQIKQTLNRFAVENIISSEQQFTGKFWAFDKKRMERMKQMVLQAEKLGKVTPQLREDWNALMQEIEDASFFGGTIAKKGGWLREAGPLGFVEQAAQLGPAGKPIPRAMAAAADMFGSAAGGMRNIGQAGRRSAAAARRRSWRQGMQGPGLRLMKQMQQAQRGGFQQKQYPKLLETIRTAAEKWSDTDRQQRQVFTDLQGLLTDIVADGKVRDRELAELKRTVSRLSQARE